jgi:methylmalonyl-CoA mutase N-terminal domain/subunit
MLGEQLAELIRSGSHEGAVRAYAKSLGPLPLSDEERTLAAQTEACIECMYLMAAADGEVADQERMQLSASVRAMLEPFEVGGSAELGLPLLKLNEQLDRFAKHLASEGLEPRIASVAGRLGTPEARCLAFCLAAAVAFVDDFVAAGEATAIDDFARALGLGSDESQYLLREVHERLA